MIERPPPIDEAVGLLERHNSQFLIKLRRDLPELESELRPGIIAGTTSPRVIERANVHVEALKTALDRCQHSITRARTRLVRGRRFKLAGSVSAAIGSAGVISSLPTTIPGATLVSGCVALAGSVASLLSEHFERLGTKASGSLIDLYLKFVDSRFTAESLLADLQVALSEKAEEMDEKTIVNLCKSSNALCHDINQWDAMLI
jgi:hypothetical protein